MRKESQGVLETVMIEGEFYFKIGNVDGMRPFLMSIVSDSDHWMFIASNGGISAGRRNAEYALFPYYTDDKLVATAEMTGSKTIFQVKKGSDTHVWEPFSVRNQDSVTRNLYKNRYGNKVIFEEVNNDLNLTYSTQWQSSDVYGFVRKSKLVNTATEECAISFIDGIQNILPYGVGSDLQNASSNLVNAYKRSELHGESGLGIYALSAIIVDKAEPSEALKANVAWSLGLEHAKYLLSSQQLGKFRDAHSVSQELDVKAEPGAYFVTTTMKLSPSMEKAWSIILNVNQTQSDVAKLAHEIVSDSHLSQKLDDDIAKGTGKLIALNASSDGLQLSSDKLNDARHFSNTLFNIMRGGIFDNNYLVEKWDFLHYMKAANHQLAENYKSVIIELPDSFSYESLLEKAQHSVDKDFQRLCIEYLPLKFSRRHGDPSRPWNKFSINTRSLKDGSKILDYEGNWRDIFQNWEALVHSYPQFIEGMIHKFVNASTFDGYNPYRITKDGFDWEAIEPDNPWSYIGYWGDHQIIYLLKFLEFIEDHNPGRIAELFKERIFVYANVPYKIKSYEDIINNAKDTIVFDEELDAEIRQRRDEMGADGALLTIREKDIIHVTFFEKLLATTLAKLSNFIPEGGIWMNTQRPEWNDANNALVGNGVSMVTLYYLRRFLSFLGDVLDSADDDSMEVSEEVGRYFRSIFDCFQNHKNLVKTGFSDPHIKLITDTLGKAGSDYRNEIYTNGFSGRSSLISREETRAFINVSLHFLDQSISANKRPDNLYHAYNLMSYSETGVSISHLDEMLEGQVAVLSSMYLQPREVLSVLDAMKSSKLFREDQYSYLLYPNKDLKGFMDRNILPPDLVEKSSLLRRMNEEGDKAIIDLDINGDYHFNGNFKNRGDLSHALGELSTSEAYGSLVRKERALLLDIFEEVFNHKAFTGRSGTFYGYEGLGSIYWHMVSKLLLAVMENCVNASNMKCDQEIYGRLVAHYYEVRAGIGVHKSPELYGAFPTDPYSHTPFNKGAQQPGMTGQVKEDIISRYGELGINVSDGFLHFTPSLLREREFLKEDAEFLYVDISGEEKNVKVLTGSMCFTYCQVLVIYSVAEDYKLRVELRNGDSYEGNKLSLNKEMSEKVFSRSGEVDRILIDIPRDLLL